MPVKPVEVTLKPKEREEIERWLKAHGTPQQVCLRSRIVLAAADGQADSMIARQLQINRETVMLWRTRFSEDGVETLWEVAPGRGRKATYGARKVNAIVNATLQTKPKGMTPLELPNDGGANRGQQVHRQQYLAKPQFEAASEQDFQAITRRAVLGEADRCSGPLPESSTAGDGFVCG